MISAHADKQGAAEYNLDLSRRRGEMVKGQLERLGLLGQQIEVTARGEKDPLTTGGSEQDHAWNRRVEIRVK